MSSTDDVRDALIRSAPQHKDTIMTRDAVVEQWCQENGKNKDDLSMDDVLAIRRLPEWQNAGS